MNKIEIKTQITNYDSIQEIPTKYHNIIEQAKKISFDAYAPYSNFYVGAAILLDNNEVVVGNNQENAAFPSGLCAERVAMFYANANFPNTTIDAIAISAHNSNGFLDLPVAPCGSCRQVLLESENRFNKAIKIFLIGEKSIYEINKVSDLLPLNFDAKSLTIENKHD